MPRIIAAPTQLDMESTGRRDYWVALGHTSIWGVHLIPLTVMVGPQAQPGEGLVAFGSTHGNEYEGPVAIKHLLREIETDAVLGRLILVPVLNVAAFRVGARESTGDDGYNLNRVFVEGAGVTPALAGITHRIAAFVRECIWPHVHMVIDLHSGGEEGRFAPLISLRLTGDPELDAQKEQMARWFGTPVVMVSRSSGGAVGSPHSRCLHNEADDLGKLALGSELGWGSAISARGVRYARHGVRAAAIRHHQLRGEIEPIDHHADGTQKLMRGAHSVSAPRPGHFEPLYECGDWVGQGQAVAWLHDFHRIDEEPLAIVSAVDGMITSQAWGARVEQGQSLLHVAQEID